MNPQRLIGKTLKLGLNYADFLPRYNGGILQSSVEPFYPIIFITFITLPVELE